ncbi:MAG: elongation factor P [Deltaproteobacteria bacterium]|nr:elongation factor P [Deltaproteobacteria bacterium]
MYSTSDLKRGLILELDAVPHLVESVSVSSPSARGASTIHRVRLRNLKTGQKVDRSYRGGETFGVADVDRRPVQLLYRDAQAFHFMDQESYEQFALDQADLAWESNFLVDEMEGLAALMHNGAPLALELPNNVVLTITETNPSVKGNSATGRTKPATLETGFVIQVPEHVDQGVKANVDTRTGEFLGRAK